MPSVTFLYVAIASIVAGFVTLAVAARDWRHAETRPRVKKHSLWIAFVVIVCAAVSGVAFWSYTDRLRTEGESAREQIYADFAQAPRIERLASAGLGPPRYKNDDEVDLNGTTALMVTLLPKSAFSRQFAPWRPIDKRLPVDKLWIKMRVNAPGFDVSPVLDETQQVPGDLMTFAWILRARQSGVQEVNINGVAFRQTAAGVVYNRATAVSSMRGIWVKPAFPLEAWSSIVTTLITVLVGGSLPFLLQAITSRRSSTLPSRTLADDTLALTMPLNGS